MPEDPGDGPEEDDGQASQPSQRDYLTASTPNGEDEEPADKSDDGDETGGDEAAASGDDDAVDSSGENDEERDESVAQEPDADDAEGADADEDEEASGTEADGEETAAEEDETADAAGDDENADADEGEGGDDEEEGDGEEGDGEDDDEEESDEEEGDEEESDWKEGQTAIDRKTGPPEDQEQPLTEHIEEMVKRVAVVLVIAGGVSLLAFPFAEEFINFLWYSVLPSDISKPHVYHPLELIVTQLKAASLLGVVLALPVFVYETYAFMRPGLYPHERRYYLAAVPTSLLLAFVGLLFGYFLILPAVMTYFMQYSRDVVDIAFALGDTFTLMLVLLGFLAVVFQIPLFVMLAIMMGLTTRTWLEERRLIIWGVFLGIAFLFSPDPTGMAPFLIALTMVGLFEGTLLLLRWTGRGG